MRRGSRAPRMDRLGPSAHPTLRARSIGCRPRYECARDRREPRQCHPIAARLPPGIALVIAAPSATIRERIGRSIAEPTAVPMENDDFVGNVRYAIRRRVGAGGMGVVYEAVDLERGCAVALKTLATVSAAGIYRLKNEFRSLADVSHPNLVALHELVSHEEHWFFTMDLVDGVDFLSWV